jgi:hypothetical protein
VEIMGSAHEWIRALIAAGLFGGFMVAFVLHFSSCSGNGARFSSLQSKPYPMRFRSERKGGTVSVKAPRAASINDFKRWFVVPE